MAEAAKRDVVNSNLHPIFGPAARAAFVGTTGKQPFLIDDQQRGGSTLLPAMKKGAPIGSEALEGIKQVNSLWGNVGSAVGFGDPNQRSDSNRILDAVLQMSGLVGNSTNVNAKVTALARERSMHKTHGK